MGRPLSSLFPETREVKRIPEYDRKQKEMLVRVPVWNCVEERILSDDESPTRRDIVQFLEKYHFCEVYRGQDYNDTQPSTVSILLSMNLDPLAHVAIFNKRTNEMYYGAENTPRRVDVENFLLKNPDCEEYVAWEKTVTAKVREIREKWLVAMHGRSFRGEAYITPRYDRENDPNPIELAPP